MAKKLKQGTISKEEKQYVLANVGKIGLAEMASSMNRSPIAIQRFIDAHARNPGDALVVPKRVAEEEVKSALRTTKSWLQLSQEFDQEELCAFEERYIALMDQFKDDVMASEHGQIFKAIKLELMMHRNLVQQKRAMTEIEKWETIRGQFLRAINNETFKEPAHMQPLTELDALLSGAMAAKQSLIKEYVSLDDNNQDILKSLKATREQRIEKNQMSKQSFTQLMHLLMERDVAEKEGRLAMQLKEQADKEYARLGREFQYTETEVDRPILNSETVNFAE